MTWARAYDPDGPDAYYDRLLSRKLAEEERAWEQKRALGPQAPDCDEPDECTCPVGVERCERPAPEELTR